MTSKCPSGMIRRKSYTRKAYTRKNGVRVKRSKVGSKCVKDMGKPGKGKRLFTLKKGGLSKYGYRLAHSFETRKKALSKSLKEYSTATLWRKLNALQILHRNTNPYYSRKVKRDMEWLRKTHGIKA